MDDKEIKIDVKWFDDLLANVNGTQMNLFEDNLMASTGAATITQAAAGNIWPYTLTGTSGTGTLIGSNSLGNLTFNNGIGWDTWHTTANPGLHVRGDAEFEGDVKINGKSINETLEKIEKRLAILHPNESLEASWEELKKLGDAYRALEKDILEKEQIWNTLKK
jgi:hypothetical protein